MTKIQVQITLPKLFLVQKYLSISLSKISLRYKNSQKEIKRIIHDLKDFLLMENSLLEKFVIWKNRKIVACKIRNL